MSSPASGIRRPSYNDAPAMLAHDAFIRNALCLISTAGLVPNDLN
jgi:hypothetical protein